MCLLDYDSTCLNNSLYERLIQMCKSLDEGGLRCESHLTTDIANIKADYNKELSKDADKAGVALDSSIVSKIVEDHKNKMADEKDMIVATHQLAMDAKKELGKPSAENEYADYSSPRSIQDSLAGMKSEIRSHIYPFSKKDAQSLLMIERVKESNVAGWDRGTEYIETVHLANHITKQLEDFEPHKQNTPANEAKYEAMQEEKASVDARLNSLRQEFRESRYTRYSTDFVEEALVKLPPPNTLRQSVLKNRIEVFQKTRQAFIDEANKRPSDDKSLRAFVKERNGGKLPFEREALKTYKTDVYDKTDKVKEFQQKVKDKESQIEISTTYRKRLAVDAEKKTNEGDHAAAAKILQNKEMLDIQASVAMLRNRKRALQPRGRNLQYS